MAQPGKWLLQLPVNCLQQACFWLGLLLLWAQMHNIWGPFPPAPGSSNPCAFCVFCPHIAPLRTDGEWSTWPHGTSAGHSHWRNQNPNLVQKTAESQARDKSCLTDQWSCAPLSGSFFPASLAALGGPDPVPSNEIEGKVCGRRERRDICEGFCFFVKGTGVEGEFS